MQRRTLMLKTGPALALGTAGVLLVTLALLPFGEGLPRAVPVLLLLVPVVVCGVVGGRIVAVAVAVEAAFALASGFLPPIGTPAVEIGHDLVALVLFMIVSAAMGVLTASILSAERRRATAEHERGEALQEVDRQRSALLRSVSHDLRTPLATIRAAATELHDTTDYDRHHEDELLEMVIDEAERLDRLVANLLSLSRIEAGALLPDRDAVDVAELVEACTKRLSRVLGRFEVEIDVAPDLPLVKADYTQLDQVVSNLLENAARHSPAGGVISVRCRANGDRLVLEVEDRGPGIEPDLREKIFQPFATATGSSSSGIGLAICRAIIEAHDGDIHATASPHGGATFVVSLPLT